MDMSLQVGDVAPEFNLRNANTAFGNEQQSLSDSMAKNGCVVVFECNHCPYVVASVDRMNNMAEYCNVNGIGFVGINSNDLEVRFLHHRVVQQCHPQEDHAPDHDELGEAFRCLANSNTFVSLKVYVSKRSSECNRENGDSSVPSSELASMGFGRSASQRLLADGKSASHCSSDVRGEDIVVQHL